MKLIALLAVIAIIYVIVHKQNVNRVKEVNETMQVMDGAATPAPSSAPAQAAPADSHGQQTGPLGAMQRARKTIDGIKQNQ